MKVIRRQVFQDVEAWELGWALVGQPWMTVRFYLVDATLIDSGQSRLMGEVLQILKGKRIERVLLTHHHEDHSGNARAIQATFGVPVLGHPETVKKMERPFKILPYQELTWGRAKPLTMLPLAGSIRTGTLELTPLPTPGHSKDHTVYWEPRRGWLFSGDLYLSDRIKYFRSDERLDDQIASLKKVLELDFDALFCAHRPQPSAGKARIAAKLQFLEDVQGNIAALAQTGMDESAIIHKLGLKEEQWVRWVTFGNVSMRNMVRSAIAASASVNAPS
jgi:glyoxylase-like metal-dependent hydrolase (beta-lactamase superfamily II)